MVAVAGRACSGSSRVPKRGLFLPENPTRRHSSDSEPLRVTTAAPKPRPCCAQGALGACNELGISPIQLQEPTLKTCANYDTNSQRIAPLTTCCMTNVTIPLSDTWWSQQCLTATRKPMQAKLNAAYGSCGVTVSRPRAAAAFLRCIVYSDALLCRLPSSA